VKAALPRERVRSYWRPCGSGGSAVKVRGAHPVTFVTVTCTARDFLFDNLLVRTR